MKNDRAKPDASVAAVDEKAEGRTGARGSHYLLLAVVCLAATAIIILVVIALTPMDEIPVQPSVDLNSLPPTPPPNANPTITLPATAAAISTEELKGELQQLADDMLARFPKAPDALHVVALLYADLQKITEAEKLWQECIQLAPDQPGPYVGLATARMELGKDEEAVQTLKQALAVGCSTSDLYDKLGAALTKLGMLEEAAAALQEGLASFPGSPDAWLQLGQVQNQLGQFSEAETSLKKAVSNGQESDSVLLSLATACARQGKQEEAAEYRKRFAEHKAARDAAAKQRFQERYDAELRHIAVAAICRAAAVCDAHGQTAEAEELFLRAYHLDPAQPVVCTEMTVFFRRQGRIADALLTQRRLAEIEPRIVEHFVNLASLCSQLNAYAEAEAALKQVMVLRPDLSIGYSGLAQLYLRLGNFRQARWFAEAALRQKPPATEEAVLLYVTLATACRQLGDHAAADAALADGRKLAPQDPRLQPTEQQP